MKHQFKLVIAAIVLCLSALPSHGAGMLVDVRVFASSGYVADPKTVYALPGDLVHVGVYLSGLETEPGGTNGLGLFQASIRTLNDGPGGYAQATGSHNYLFHTDAAWDFADSDGTVADSTFSADTDTDLDVISISSGQVDGGPAYHPGIGNGQEVLFGVGYFTVQPGAGSFDLNTYYNGTGGLFGGLSIRTLINTATDDSNGLYPGGNLASDAAIGSPVHVYVPEPTSLCLIGVAASGLLGRRRPRG